MTNDSNGQADYSSLRRRYEHAPFDEAHLASHPLAQFETWYADAIEAGIPEPNAMVVSTADEKGRPSARHVLLKAADSRGFVFYTNFESQKGRELAANPAVSLLFPWIPLFRQVLVQGVAVKVPAAEADEYFASRPYGSQVGAWASLQSQPLADRADFETRLAECQARFQEGQVPRPPHWGGFLVQATQIEFWAGHESRLHDRLRFATAAGEPAPLDVAAAWSVTRLYP